jgi:CBS domain-containing protein
MPKLRDIMTREVITVSPELSIRDAMDLLATSHVSGVPVVAGDEVVGVVSATDLMAFAAGLDDDVIEREDVDEAEEPNGWDDGSDAPAAYFAEMWKDSGREVKERFARPFVGSTAATLEGHVVSEIMTRSVLSLPSSTDVRVAADVMRRAKVHRLLVIDDGKLRGIVSAMDIARAAADGRLTTRTYVFNKAPLDR